MKFLEKLKKKTINYYYYYSSGEIIPKVEYNEGELKTWKLIYNKLSVLYKTHACREHREAFASLENEGLYSPDFVPQLEDVSKFLKSN